MVQVYVFDLDGTVIDSSHRHATLPCGALNLPHWIENSTPEKIALDTLLPLAESMRKAYAAGHHVIVCTARVMSKADIAFLEQHGLKYHALLSRPEGDRSKDGALKQRLLTCYLNRMQRLHARVSFSDFIMFDDNWNVLETVRRMGIAAFDAVQMNALLQGKTAYASA